MIEKFIIERFINEIKYLDGNKTIASIYLLVKIHLLIVDLSTKPSFI
jgi:hypothetical protein